MVAIIIVMITCIGSICRPILALASTEAASTMGVSRLLLPSLPRAAIATAAISSSSLSTGFVARQTMHNYRVATMTSRRRAFRPLSSSLSSSSTPNVAFPSISNNEMPLPLPPLNNYYYLLRHGQSTANVYGIISSSRNLAYSSQHGLTLLGIQQGKESATSLLDLIHMDILQDSIINHHSNETENDSNNGHTDDDDVYATSMPKSTKRGVYFYSSPFARAKETAESCLTRLSLSPELTQRSQEMGLEINNTIAYHDGLMERYFGRLDGKELGTYAYVWPVDMFDPTHTAFDVESVAAVCHRIRSTLLDIDSRHNNNNIGGGDKNHIVLTSHADVLQITQVYAAGIDNVGRFSQYRFGNGEVRRMGRELDSLPEAKPLEPPKREN